MQLFKEPATEQKFCFCIIIACTIKINVVLVIQFCLVTKSEKIVECWIYIVNVNQQIIVPEKVIELCLPWANMPTR